MFTAHPHFHSSPTSLHSKSSAFYESIGESENFLKCLRNSMRWMMSLPSSLEGLIHQGLLFPSFLPLYFLHFRSAFVRPLFLFFINCQVLVITIVYVIFFTSIVIFQFTQHGLSKIVFGYNTKANIINWEFWVKLFK